MREYAILVRERPGRLPDVATVPFGFSWGAFLFQALWALYRGVWLTALVLFVAGLVVSTVTTLLGAGPLATATIELAVALCLAVVAQDLRRFELARRRFRLVDIVSARSLAEAEERGIRGWVDKAVEQPPAPAEISPPQGLQSLANRSI